jgi:hypothetical protein
LNDFPFPQSNPTLEGQGHISTPTLDITICLPNIRFTKEPFLPMPYEGVRREGPPASEYVIIAPDESQNKKGL